MRLNHKNVAITIFFSAIVVAAVCVLAQYLTFDGVVLAAAPTAGMWDEKMQTFRRGLSRKLEKLVWRYGKWSKLTDIVDVKKFKETGTYAGAMSLPTPKNLIHVIKDFEREGGIYMDIPVLVPIGGRGRMGRQGLRGHEVRRALLTKKTCINQLRQGIVVQDNKMSKAVLKKPEIQTALMEKGTEDLSDWFHRRLNMYPYQAILAGYSDNLTDPVAGLNKTVKSHPNTYVQDYGKIPFANVFNAAYETAMSNGLASLVDSPAKHFKFQTIRNLIYLANYHKVQPLMISGKLLYILFIHPAQAWQLKNDPEYQTYVKDAGVRGDANVIWTGQLEGTVIDGALIVIDDTMPAARINGDADYDSDWGTVNYGLSTYMDNPRDAGDRKPAIIAGAGCITAGYGSELSFESETWDYKQFMADGADMIVGFERADIIDDDNYFGYGEGAFYENSTSVVMWTYSKDMIADI